MSSKRISLGLGLALLVLAAAPGFAGVQYSNDFENPSSPNVQTAWPEWIIFANGTMQAVNGRIEWDNSGGNNDWIRLNQEVPNEYVFEFDYFHQAGVNGRFSVWPFCKEGDSIFDRYNYFIRKNTHFFNGADTVPSEGPRDLTLPLGEKPHRLRFEITGDHVAFLFKDRGEGGWILVDERDFPHIDNPRYIQLGFNHDSGAAGLVYVDNIVLSYRSQNLFSYSNNFDNPSSANVQTAWPEWIIFTGGTLQAVNNRLQWDATGGNNDWIRLDKEMPNQYVYEFDFFYQENTNGRFSVWPFCIPGDSIFERYNYFVRKNTHFFNGADTVPSEGPRDLTLPIGANPHRLRFEITGDHVAFLFKDRGAGGWILVDERDFPHVDNPRYIQLGYNHDGGTAGLIYVDNIVVNELAANRATVDRAVGAANFTANTPVPVSLKVTVTGTLPSISISEGIPEGWSVSNISNNGVVSDGNIIWTLANVSQSLTLTYNAVPPRLIRSRVAGFSGSVDSGEGEERISGDTAIAIKLPYLYRETIDYDFSGSPVNGKKYPAGADYGVRYAQGMDGIPSDVAYQRPGDGSVPAVDTVFTFPANADFRSAIMTGGRGGSYTFEDYRDLGEIVLEHGASDTNAGVGSETMTAGDWFRYTFDLGEGNQVLLINLSINTWGQGECPVDIYVDNKFKGAMLAPNTAFNAYYFFTVGPFEVSGGEHAIVVALPGAVVPDGIGRMEVVRLKGIGNVSRQLTADGFFDPANPLKVTLNAQKTYGTYSPVVVENVPPGSTVTNVSDGGAVDGANIVWTLPDITASKSITYTIQPPAGAKFLLFNGLYDTGLPLAEVTFGDASVVNQVWLFGKDPQSQKDDFNGSAVASPWLVEYGNDASLNTNYKEGVTLTLDGGILTLGADTIGTADKFNEWSNGRRAPMILRTDVPAGDWRIETKCTFTDTFTWTNFNVGLVVAYNAANDTNVSGDEYLFGFNSGDIRVELTNKGAFGVLQYHQFTDELDWLDAVMGGDVNAAFAVTRRGNELIFSAQTPGRSWQLVGAPVTEKRQATRIGLFTKISGSENYSLADFDYFTLSQFEVFVDVADWALY
ncbi:MAG: Ig-like domain-containing protein [Candidatus Omnitrophota bacterium]